MMNLSKNRVAILVVFCPRALLPLNWEEIWDLGITVFILQVGLT